MSEMSRAGRVSRFVVPLLLLTVASIVAALLVLARPTVEAQPRREKIWAVRVVTVEPQRRQPKIRHFGRIVASRRVPLDMRVGGRVTWVSPRLIEGGRVSAGEVLVRLDPFDYEIALRKARAQLEEARARLAELEAELAAARDLEALIAEQVAVAEREVDRQKKLRGRKVATEKALDAARVQLAVQRMTLRENRRRQNTLEERIAQQLAVIERLQAAVEGARRDLAETELKAPFDAIVGEVDIGLGRELKPRERIAILYDLAGLELAFSLTDREFGRLWPAGLLGRAIEARWYTVTRSFRLAGRISRLASEIDAASGGVELRATITDNPDTAPLRPGAFLEVTVPDLVYEGVVALPRSALYEGDRVYVVRDGRLEPRSVERVGSDGPLVLVRGALAAGEQVVVSRLAEIGPGLRVRVVS